MTNGMLGVVGSGGALGAMARYIMSAGLGSVNWFGYPLPLTVLTANILGSFGSGVMLGWADVSPVDPTWPALITFGFMGGLTAYSSFSQETVVLAEQIGVLASVAYVGLSVGISAGAFVIGRYLGARLIPIVLP